MNWIYNTRLCKTVDAIVKVLTSPEDTAELPVRLAQLPFPNEQPVDSNIKFNPDRSIVTRIGEDYRYAFVCLRDTLTSNEFILIQILEVDRQHVGGLKLYLESFSRGSREILFADSKSEPSDCIIFWMNRKNILFCGKDGKIQSLDSIRLTDARNYKLVCEMYGPVQKIRAYVGQLNPRENVAPNLQNNCPEEPKSNEVFLSLRIDHSKNEIQEIKVNNLPPIVHSSLNADYHRRGQ